MAKFKIVEYWQNEHALEGQVYSKSYAAQTEIKKSSGILWWKEDYSKYGYVNSNGEETWFTKDVITFEKYEHAESFIKKLGGEIVI